MKVKELIKQLENCDPNATVILYVNEYDAEVYDVEPIPFADVDNMEYDTGWSIVENMYLGKSIVYIKGDK